MSTTVSSAKVVDGLNATGGPSTYRAKRKPAAPHPSTAKHNASAKRRKLPPPLPVSASLMQDAPSDGRTHAGARPGASKTLPLKTLQGVGTKRTGVGRKAAGLGREVVLITRKMGVGAYLGRCRSLICDEGYTHIVLNALGAAIPQALIILHALLDVLPYPRHPRGVWYELFTGSIACTDEEEVGGSGASGHVDAPDGAKDAEGGEKVKSWLKNIGSVEAADTVLKERIAASLQIHIHIGPKAEVALKGATKTSDPASTSFNAAAPTSKTAKKRNRPSKSKRKAMALQKEAGAGRGAKDGMEVDEEAALNGAASSDEEVEMVE